MILSKLRIALTVLCIACSLEATPDISNLKNCIKDVRKAEASSPHVLTFDTYTNNFGKLMTDLEAASATLPFVYQEAAAKPLIQFLENFGEPRFLEIFSGHSTDEEAALFQEIIPDAALSILMHEGINSQEINAFQEIVSDLYDGFLSDEDRIEKQTGSPIEPPTYGTLPPLVKFGNPDAGPYTWPCDATSQILGMKCGIVSLPPAQIKGGLIAWSCLGHETGGHDVTHADEGLLDELAKKVYNAVLKQFKSKKLAAYWSKCIDESSADVCGYLNMGPSLGIALIGYFRALGDGKLRSYGSSDDPHPIDLLRGYLGAAVVKHLNFKEAEAWSYIISKETSKDNERLYFVDQDGNYMSFPVSFDQAVASTEVVARVIMQTKLSALQNHSLQELQDWRDYDQGVVDNLVSILKTEGRLPATLSGSGLYAAYVVAAATQAALQHGADIPTLFKEMKSFLATMHLDNLTWSRSPTNKALALLEKGVKGAEKRAGNTSRHIVSKKLPQSDALLVLQL